jgi:protein required for attachment to host cells
MQQQMTWVLVCDASRARLFQAASRGEKLTLLDEMEHAESRAHGRDLTTDAPGRKPVGPTPARGGGSNGAYGRPGAEPDTDPKEVEAQKFARELAERLAKGLNDHAYERLIMTAPPHFLGLMRASVSTQVEKHVGATLDKDFTHLDAAEIARRLENVLQPTN